MRFAIDINLKGKPPFLLPSGYRSDIVALIKEMIKLNDIDNKIYEEYLGNNNRRAKPYTFFLDIPNACNIQIDYGEFFKLNIPSIKLYISSSSTDFFSLAYNGFLKMKNNLFLFNYPIEVSEFKLTKFNAIYSNYTAFKILSPVIVRDIAINGCKKNFKGYLSCHNPSFDDSLVHSIVTLCRHFLNSSKIIQYDDIGIDSSGCRSVKMHHYHEIIPGTKGVIKIKAAKEVLELIYDIGLGARRSQGFGMVDVININQNEQIYVSEKMLIYN